MGIFGIKFDKIFEDIKKKLMPSQKSVKFTNLFPFFINIIHLKLMVIMKELMKILSHLGLIIVLTIMFSLAPIQEAKAANNFISNLGPFKVSRAFCEKIQKISAIMNVYTNVTWPVVGIPGIATGLLSNTSALIDFCNFVTNLEALGTADAIFYAANYANTLAGEKWNHHLTFMQDAWSLSNTFYDFENGTTRKGALKSVDTHRQLNDFANSSYKWYNKTFNNKDAELRTRGEREADMAEISRASYQKAVLKEATNCPTGDNNSQDYTKLYNAKIKPSEDKSADYKEDIDFYKNQLLVMGPRFLANEGELAVYTKGIENLQVNGVSYTVTERTKTDKTTKPKKAKDGTVTQVPVTISRPIQKYQVLANKEVLDNFKTAWSKKWTSWVTGQYLSRGSYGLFNDPKGRVEEEFKDLSYECNPSRLMKGISSERADYSSYMDKKITDCKSQQKMKQKDAENLFAYYSDKLVEVLRQYKTEQGKIWEVQSEYLGINRSVTKKVQDGFQQEEVRCADANTISEAVLTQLQLKSQSVNNDLTERIAKDMLKMSTMEINKEEASVKSSEELAKRNQFVENKIKDDQKVSKTVLPPVPLEIPVKDSWAEQPCDPNGQGCN
jgi:hypothetical protein